MIIDPFYGLFISLNFFRGASLSSMTLRSPRPKTPCIILQKVTSRHRATAPRGGDQKNLEKTLNPIR